MAADNRTIKELSALGLANAAPLCIQYPAAAQGKTDEFELKSSLLHHIPTYHGLSMEDPNKHLKEFEAFPFSLLEKAKDWLYELAPGTVTSWDSMKRAFLEKFFPTSRVILLRKRISGIQQNQGESFPSYYERFKSLVSSCPQHQMKEELLIQYFYEGLLPMECQMLDASTGGALVDKTPGAAKVLIANRAHNAQQYEGVGQRDPPRPQVNEPPQPAQTNSSKSLYNDTVSKLLTNLSQGQEDQNEAMRNQDKRLDHLEKQIGQIAEFVGQFQDQGKLPISTIANPKEGFETAKEIILRSGKEVGTDPQPSKSNHKEDERLQFKEEEHTQHTARVETPLPQAPIAPTPSNSGKVVPNLILSNPIPPNVPIPCKFMNSKEEESEKDILEALPKVQSMEYQEFVKEDVLEANNPKEVEFYDTRQGPILTPHLAECKVPETFKEDVFILEFLLEHTVENAWRSLPHPHYYLPLQFLYTSTFMARHTPKNA
ncbi:S ribonuclease [Pyrus ussuriensis x Pyrus communis]|uniref:S ribonuclease n=1 Tax=Pyrus ussuriensis x Pyrus communis TaxID=2448454 RepID=A0A5N5HQS8_9ROSA|nr:S ribonuclease [Pyrus ussuriensis x Pyrus communis]